MRPLYIIGGSIAVLALAGVLAWTRLAPAQVPAPPPQPAAGELATITVPEVDVRSGPSPSFYATSKLRYGSTVKVVNRPDKTNPEWLAIEPPQGSRSWINKNDVKMTGQNTGIVVTDEKFPAPIKPASSVTDQEPNVESAKLARGMHVVVVGPEKYGANAYWLPIEPPQGDVRYIPVSAVAKVNSQPTPPVNASTTGFVIPPGTNQSVLAEADAALSRAMELYRQAAQSSDAAQRQQALSRLQYLQQLPPSQGTARQPGYPSSSGAVGPPNVALGTTPMVAQPTGGSTAMYAATVQTGPAQWTKWGTLRRTNIPLKDGRNMFRLEDDRGAPLGYAVAAPGLTLEPYVGRLVCVYGPTAYHSDSVMRGDYTIVSQLSLADR